MPPEATKRYQFIPTTVAAIKRWTVMVLGTEESKYWCSAGGNRQWCSPLAKSLAVRESSTELPSTAWVHPQEEEEHPHKALQENTDVLTVVPKAAAELSA